MELWIRSQDKELLTKVKHLEVYGSKTEWWIMANDNDLGVYATKERALEVLDEIQSYLVNINGKDGNIFYYVYEHSLIYWSRTFSDSPSILILPLFNHILLSHNLLAAPKSCVTNTIVLPSFFNSCILLKHLS